MMNACWVIMIIIIIVKLIVTGLIDSVFFCVKYCLGKEVWVFHVDFFNIV